MDYQMSNSMWRVLEEIKVLTQHDIADVRTKLSKIEAKCRCLEDRIDNVYKKIPIITAYWSLAVFLTMVLMLRLHRKNSGDK